MTDNYEEKNQIPKPRQAYTMGWALPTADELLENDEDEEQSEEDNESQSDDNDTFGLELDTTWGVEIKDTEYTQYRPINENCVRRDVRYPPQLYLISYGEADNCKCLAHLTQVIHKRGEQKSETKTILKKVIPAMPNMTWLCLDEVESKLHLVFGRIEKGVPVYYFKEFDLELGAHAVVGCRRVTMADDSQAMIRIDLGEVDDTFDSLIPFLSPNYPTLLFYSCKMNLYDPRPAKGCPRFTKQNYIGTLRFETVGKKKQCRAKYHDYFVSWASPFDIVYFYRGTHLAIFPIPIENYSEAERKPMIRRLTHDNNTRGIGMASVRVYSLVLGEDLFLRPSLRDSISFGQLDLMKSLLVPARLNPSDCPDASDIQDVESKVECFCHPYYKVFWGKVYKYGLVAYPNRAVVAVKNLHRKLFNGEIPNIPEEDIIFIDYFSDIFLGKKVALDCEGIQTRLVGKMGSMLYFTRADFHSSEMAVRQLEVGNVFRGNRVCANCSATETKKRKRFDGKRIASFKVCRECKKRGFHKKYRKYACFFCSDECQRAAWKEHKKIHASQT